MKITELRLGSWPRGTLATGDHAPISYPCIRRRSFINATRSSVIIVYPWAARYFNAIRFKGFCKRKESRAEYTSVIGRRTSFPWPDATGDSLIGCEAFCERAQNPPNQPRAICYYFRVELFFRAGDRFGFMILIRGVRNMAR